MHGRVLVTGGAGYLGSIVVEELVGRGYSIRVLDSLVYGGVPSLLHVWGHERFEFVRGDVCDSEARARALQDVSVVVHLAAVVGDPACARQPELARTVNLEATRALLHDADAAGVRRFLFASTCSNYGKMSDGGAFATEEWELRPTSLYAETKVAAERNVLDRSFNGMTTCCLRFATLYGASARMRFDLTVNEFVRDVAVAGNLDVFGEQFWRPYLHLRDAARAVVLALEAPVDLVAHQVFNVGATAENYRKLDIVGLLTARFPSARISFVHRDEDPRDYRVSFDKIKSCLGFTAKRSVSDGIEEVITLLESGLVNDPYGPAYRN